MDALTLERLSLMWPVPARDRRPVNRWGDTAAQVEARRQALERTWR